MKPVSLGRFEHGGDIEIADIDVDGEADWRKVILTIETAIGELTILLDVHEAETLADLIQRATREAKDEQP